MSKDKITVKERRWQEVCECFRHEVGTVTTTEAALYMRKGHLFFKKLVKMNMIKASFEKSNNGFIYWIKVTDALAAVRTPMADA